VLIIGGGYDINKDATGVGTTDSEGRGVFIIDAVTGALIWSATPATNSASNLQITTITDSVPAPVGVLDSNGDGISDRIYFGDAGGNIWRVDLAGDALPTSSQNTWSMFKLASFGGDTGSTDRRFMNRVDVMRSADGALAYDGIAVGSGNRAHPLETDVVNRFYLIRDTETRTSYHGAGGTTVPSALTETNMYDATANLLQDGTTSQQTAALTSLGSKNGWYITLERSGEKNLAPSVTLNGAVFFTTFVPDVNANQCVPLPGKGYLYAVSLKHGAAVFNWNTATSGLTQADRRVDIGARLPDSVTPHFGEDTIRIIGVGAGDQGSGSYNTGTTLTTLGTYWYKPAN
jgi:type IV pilus assembly protein PilY1